MTPPTDDGADDADATEGRSGEVSEPGASREDGAPDQSPPAGEEHDRRPDGPADADDPPLQGGEGGEADPSGPTAPPDDDSDGAVATDGVGGPSAMDARRMDPFWMDRVADRLRLSVLSRWLSASGTPLYGAVILMSLVTLVDVLVLSGVEVPEPGVYRIDNPGAPALVVGWPLVVFIMIHLRTRYYGAIEELPDPDPDIGRSEELDHTPFWRVLQRAGLMEDWSREDPSPVVPPRLKWGILVGAIVVNYAWLSTGPFDLPAVTNLSTWVEVREFVKFYLFTPATYFVAGTEFISFLAAIHIVLPYRIRGTGAIDFTDPQGYAGLRPVGRLVTRSSVLFLVLVSVFAVWVSLPGGVSWSGTMPKLLLVGGSGFAVIMFVGPVFWLHRHIAAHKEAKIDAITGRVEDYGPDETIFPDADFESSEDVMAYTHEYINLTRVEATSEYPVDMQMVQNLVGMLVLPYVTGYTSEVLFGFLP